MHSFHWVPADGKRHASRDKRPWGSAYPSGMRVNTLCRQEVVAEATAQAWLWGTCLDCNGEARKIAESADRLSPGLFA